MSDAGGEMSRPLRYRTELGIGQHKLDMRDPLRMEDVVGMLCLVGFIAWLIWLCWFAVEYVP